MHGTTEIWQISKSRLPCWIKLMKPPLAAAWQVHTTSPLVHLCIDIILREWFQKFNFSRRADVARIFFWRKVSPSGSDDEWAESRSYFSNSNLCATTCHAGRFVMSLVVSYNSIRTCRGNVGLFWVFPDVSKCCELNSRLSSTPRLFNTWCCIQCVLASPGADKVYSSSQDAKIRTKKIKKTQNAFLTDCDVFTT